MVKAPVRWHPKVLLLWLIAFTGLLSVSVLWAMLRAAAWLLCAGIIGAVHLFESVKPRWPTGTTAEKQPHGA